VEGAKLTADQVKQYCKGKVWFIVEIWGFNSDEN
jgi:hypothetical protein